MSGNTAREGAALTVLSLVLPVERDERRVVVQPRDLHVSCGGQTAVHDICTTFAKVGTLFGIAQVRKRLELTEWREEIVDVRLLPVGRKHEKENVLSQRDNWKK